MRTSFITFFQEGGWAVPRAQTSSLPSVAAELRAGHSPAPLEDMDYETASNIPFDIVVAVDSEGGIGKRGTLPWHLPEDLKHFKKLTLATTAADKKNVVVMGRKTWQSLPEAFRPLPGRINVVLTRDKTREFPLSVAAVPSFGTLFEHLMSMTAQFEKVFVIGGAEVFSQALLQPNCQKIHLTKIFRKFDCDTFFPSLESWKVVSQSPVFDDHSLEYCFKEYVRE